MSEYQRNQRVADRICRELEWDGQRFSYGQWVLLMDGRVVTVGTTLDEVCEAADRMERDPDRSLVFEVADPVTDVVVIRYIA